MRINDMLVSDYLDAVRLRGRRPATVKTYAYSLQRYVRYLGDTPVTDATPRDVRRFLAAEQEAGTAPTSVARFHGDVRAFYRWCLAEGEVTVSPVDRVPAPVAPVAPVPVVPAADLKRLLAVRGRGRFCDTRNRLALLLLVDTGIRVGELLNIRTGDVNLSQNTVTVSGKTGPRTVGFGSRTAIELRRHLRVRETHRLAERRELFLSRSGPWGYPQLWRMLERYARRAGVAPIHPHALRHTWASKQLESDVPQLAVMAAGGWTKPETLARYTRGATERMAATINQRNSIADGL